MRQFGKFRWVIGQHKSAWLINRGAKCDYALPLTIFRSTVCKIPPLR